MRRRACLSALALSQLVGCASIVNGQNQSLSVQARSADGQPVVGAICNLKNNKGEWFVTSPGSTVVQRSYESLAVRCAKAPHAPGLASVKSHTKGMAAGNLLFGGVVGVGVDMATGAAYDYPALVTVTMGRPADAAQAKAAAAAPAAPGLPPIRIAAPWDAEQARLLLAPGGNVVRGSTRQPDGASCAGGQAHLIPATGHAVERLQKLYGTSGDSGVIVNPRRRTFVPDLVEYRQSIRQVPCDAEGNFAFGGVADGEFYVWASVRTGPSQRSALLRKVTASGGRAVDVALAPPARAEPAAAASAAS